MDKQKIKQQALERKRRRIRKNVEGSTERPRLAVFRSERHIYGQIIDDLAGRTLVAASTLDKELKGESLSAQSPTDQAKAVGELLATRAQAKGIQAVVFDRGGRRYGGRVAALADGARAQGLQF